jgi:hypothetical protein
MGELDISLIKSRVESGIHPRFIHFDTGRWLTEVHFQMYEDAEKPNLESEHSDTVSVDMAYIAHGSKEASSSKDTIITTVNISDDGITEAEIGSAIFNGWALANAYQLWTPDETIPLRNNYDAISAAAGTYTHVNRHFVSDITQHMRAHMEDFELWTIAFDRH